MKSFILLIIFLSGNIGFLRAAHCGCKELRSCYKKMLDKLLDVEEDACVENVAIGTSTVTIFLKALQQFCGEVIQVHSEYATNENRLLYEVVLNISNAVEGHPKPIIMLDAGQQAGSQPAMLALFIIEQLVGCEEYNEMIEQVTWVILPYSNPDGHEYFRCKREPWFKNMIPLHNNLSFGVDISRNFDDSWNNCPHPDNVFSQEYPGPAPASENETIFISKTIEKHKQDLEAYVSIRRDGHSILYPFASKSDTSSALENVQRIASQIAAKINQRSANIQWFQNSSIHDMNGEPRCGHSVDYAFNKHNIPYTFEMRVFPETNHQIMSKFQALPKGYDASLRNGYFSGIIELFNIIAYDETV